MGRGRGGEGRRWGESQWSMEIPGIRMCDGDVYASYEGRYGVGGDVCATGGATEGAGGGGLIFVVFLEWGIWEW